MKNKCAIFLKTCGIVLLVLIVGLLPFFVLAMLDHLPAQFDQTYYYGLKIKYERLSSLKNEKKIVVIGGSNVAFGIDSALMEKELGVPVVNFGLYADIGTVYMTDLALPCIGKGDVVVLIPELDAQAYSGFYGARGILCATEGNYAMRTVSSWENFLSLLKDYPDYLQKKTDLSKSGTKVVPEGVYAASSFNGRGDMCFLREKNVMSGGYMTGNLPVTDRSLLTQEFADIVNAFTKKAEARGARVYFSFPPVNERAVKATAEQLAEFSAAVRETFSCKVISSLADRVMDAGYFYDSNYHTNDAGEIYNTVLLIGDLKRQAGDMRAVNVEIPAPVTVEEPDPSGEKEENGFLYRMTAEGGIALTGLTGKRAEEARVEVPAVLSGFAVTEIADHAFQNCNAEEIVIPASVKKLGNGLFSGAERLSRVTLLETKMPTVGDGLFFGANAEVKIYLSSAIYDYCMTDYFWGRYGERLRRREE